MTDLRLVAAGAGPFLAGVLLADAGPIGRSLGSGPVRASWVLLILSFCIAGRIVAGRLAARCARHAFDGCVAAGVLIGVLSQASGPGALALGGLVAGVLLAPTAGPQIAQLIGPAAEPGRVAGAWVAIQIGAAGLGVLAAGAMSGAGFTWRAHLLVVGVLLSLLGVAGRRLVPRTASRPGEPTSVAGLSEVESAAQALIVASLAGLALVMLPGRLSAVLQISFQQSAPARPVLVSLVVSTALLAVLLAARPAWHGRLSVPHALVAAAALLAVGSQLMLPVVVACTALALVLLTFVVGQAAAALVATVPSGSRPVGLAMVNVSVFLLGGALGSFLLGGIATRYGEPAALAILAVPVLAAGIPARRMLTALPRDRERLRADLVSSELIAAEVRAGRSLPLLSCQRVSYAYGPLQVLFDVDFTVAEGELVALLGTNGAGKSSLLRAISGLGAVTGGTVHLQGRELTRLSAETRVGLGVVQVPGGRAVFPPLSVVDNLRVYGNSLGRDRRAVERGIERSFAFFPALAAARNRPAGALSGGQQQMVALAKALILQPKLLLIDELSLGLAPKVVGELLESVRAINREGTAVVLVEQSVNIAVSIATHAYFMEKGRVLFDGPAAGLMDRTDLLRAVFLRDAGAPASPAAR